MNESFIRNVIEAALLAAGKPLLLPELTQLFDEKSQPSTEELRAALDALSADYANRGIEIKETASGFRVQVRREFAGEISRLWPERPAKYSRALLETLALIAYRQPITRAEIEAVRGVAVNPSILKAMLERNWIRVVGHRDVPGRPELLGTTREFLDYFGLKRLDDLPPLAELKAMGDIKVQLELPGSMEPSDGAAAPAADTAAADGSAGGETEGGNAGGAAGATNEGPASEAVALEGAASEGADGAAVGQAVDSAEADAQATTVAAGAAVAAPTTDTAAGEGDTVADSADAALQGDTADAPAGASAAGDEAADNGRAAEATAGAESDAERILSETESPAEVQDEPVAPVRRNVASPEDADAVADEPAEVIMGDAAGDDDAAEDEELSAEGGGTHELVAAPPRNDD